MGTARKHLSPLEARILSELNRQGPRGLSQMDAMRALGVAGGSFTKRISTLRAAGMPIRRTEHTDPFTGRVYGRYILERS